MGVRFAKAESPSVTYHAGDEEMDEDMLNLQKPAFVNTIFIEGLKNSENELVSKQLQRLFECETFDSIITEAHLAKLKLERIGVFSQIGVYVDVHKKNKEKREDYDVYYFLKEKRRISGQAGTNVGHNEGNVAFGARLNNIRGKGEALNGNISFGTKVSNCYEFGFSKPLFLDPDMKLKFRLSKSLADLSPSFYKEDSKGIGFDVTIPSMFGVHTLDWNYLWRSNLISPNAPFDIREHAGHSLKSSLKHSFISDGRDDWILPRNGHMFKHNIEYSGIGGDVNMIKTDFEVQLNKEIFPNVILSGTVNTGAAKALKNQDCLLINDRFFIGGPLSVRGYAMKGIGNHSDAAALGGDIFWGGGLHLYTPLPFRPGKGGFGELFRLHLFANGGNISNMNSIDVKDFLANPRYSYGVGVMLMLGGIARLEVNYCVPKNPRPGDIINEGLQVGVGINFL